MVTACCTTIFCQSETMRLSCRSRASKSQQVITKQPFFSLEDMVTKDQGGPLHNCRLSRGIDFLNTVWTLGAIGTLL